jgi:hypothetical protein
MFMRTKIAAAVIGGLFAATLSAAPITTEGTGIGKHGDVTVAVTFDNGRIQDIKIVKEQENKVLAAKVYTDPRCFRHFGRDLLVEGASRRREGRRQEGGRHALEGRQGRDQEGRKGHPEGIELRRGRDRCGRRGLLRGDRSEDRGRERRPP